MSVAEKVISEHWVLDEDFALKEKLKAFSDKQKAQEEAAVAELIGIAKEAGFEFSDADLTEHGKQAVNELSDDQLKAVAGGAFPASVNGQITDAITQ